MSFICFKSFIDLIEEDNFSFERTFKNSEQYFAHSPIENIQTKYETLKDHSEHTRVIFLELIKVHNLEPVIDKHILKLVKPESIKNKKMFGDFIKLLFYKTVFLHDVGKINPNFQIEKMNQTSFKKVNNGLSSNHSLLSVYLIYSLMLENIVSLGTDEENGIAYVILLLFTMPIRKHHSSVLTNPFTYFECQEDNDYCDYFAEKNLMDLSKYLETVSLKYDELFHDIPFKGEKLIADFKVPFCGFYAKLLDSFSLFSLLKLNSSLLTISDYFATSEYMWNQKIGIGGIIDEELRQKMENKFYSTQNYNVNLKDFKQLDVSEIKSKSKTNLNKLRMNMIFEVRKTLKTNIKNNLFFLEAPTGGGKTNMSFMAVTELLQNRKELNKVFYVFPFTTLATQTSKSIQETFDLKESEFIELHSKSSMKKIDNEEDFGSKKKNFVDFQFVNYPISLLTHIKFFDIVKSNSKNDNYLYHKLANSIVVIDELQAYTPEHWDKIYYFMKNLSEIFNTVFIVMSATLPKIDELKILEGINFIHLIKKKEQYFSNCNFAKRVTFDLSLYEKGENTLSEIGETLLLESEKYSEEHDGKCWALIEFIFKKSVTEFYEEIQSEAEKLEYEIRLLSGTILEPVRRKLIEELKNDEYQKEHPKIILISTQVVEAGVDLDFDLGFKDSSIIDSDEQLAGRINRNANKDGCKVFLFNYNLEYRIYGKDYRYKSKKKIDKFKYKEILSSKNFDKFYDETFKFIDTLNNSKSRYGFSDYEDNLINLNYSGVHSEFKLIEQNTFSVFVDVEFDLAVYDIKIDSNELKKKVVSDNKIIGSRVFKLYCDIIENKELDFIKKKISFVEIQGLMSNFIFSVFKNPELYNDLLTYGEEKYGFIP